MPTPTDDQIVEALVYAIPYSPTGFEPSLEGVARRNLLPVVRRLIDQATDEENR
jgi:hypothetical protein